MSNNNVKVLFKFAYWHHKMEYDFPEDTTIRELIAFMQKRAYTDFEFFKLDPIEYPCITIVEAGQYNNVNGYDPELAPAIQPSGQTIKERYKGKYEQIGFFIRYSSPLLEKGGAKYNRFCYLPFFHEARKRDIYYFKTTFDIKVVLTVVMQHMFP